MGQPSGKFVLRIPPNLHTEIKKRALAEDPSINSYILKRLQNDKEENNESEFSEGLTNLRDHFGSDLLGVVLFGSRARGDFTDSSDIDLLLVMSYDFKISRELYTAWDSILAMAFPKSVNPQFVCALKDPEYAGSIWLECAMDGMVLLDHTNIVQNLLSSIRGKIAEGNFVRKWKHGHPYWINQKDRS